MRKLREILRLRPEAELSLRQIKGSLRLSLGAVQKVASRAQALDLDWAAIDALDDQQLARLIYPASDVQISNQFQLPDWAEALQELKRKGVTKHLLWEERKTGYENTTKNDPMTLWAISRPGNIGLSMKGWKTLITRVTDLGRFTHTL